MNRQTELNVLIAERPEPRELKRALAVEVALKGCAAGRRGGNWPWSDISKVIRSAYRSGESGLLRPRIRDRSGHGLCS